MMQSRRTVILAGLVVAFSFGNIDRAKAADGSIKVGVEVVFLSEADGKADAKLSPRTQSALGTTQFKAYKTKELRSNTTLDITPGTPATLPGLPNGHTITLSVSADRKMLKAVLSTKIPTNVEAPLSGGSLLVVDAKPYNGGILVVAITTL